MGVEASAGAATWHEDAALSPRDPSLRRDLAILIILAALVRFVRFDQLGVDHFDAGAYAMTAAAIANGEASGGVYPLLHFLSPPLYFGLGATLMTVLSSTSASILAAVSALAGVATVVVVYVAGRRWFGRGAGGVAAWLLALSDYHILYSRTSLTDVLFCALFIGSLVVFARAEERQSHGLAALAGVLIGLAWNTKYHGWLAGVIAAAAVVPAFIQGNGPQRRGIFVRLSIAATIAIAMYLPWLFFVQSRDGGYARLTAEHARFLTPGSLIDNAISQVRAQRYLEGWLARLSPFAAITWLAVIVPPARRLRAVFWGIGLVTLSLATSVSVVIGMLAFVALVPLYARMRLGRSSHWFALAFFSAFTLLSPLYTPYPRLLLPWFVSAVLLSSVTIAWLVTAQLPTALRSATPIGIAVAGALLLMARGARPAAIPWRPSNAMHAGAAQVDRLAVDSLPIFVIGEPGVVFELRRLGRVARHIDLAADATRSMPQGSPFYLVGGIYSRRVGGPISLASWLQAHPEASLTGTASVPTVGDVRLLDDFSTDDAHAFRRSRLRNDYDLTVYHVTGSTR